MLHRSRHVAVARDRAGRAGFVLALLGCLGLACAAPEESLDAGSEPQDAAASADAAVASAAANLAGVWQQPVSNYPDLMVVWAFSPAGWGNIDVRGSSGSWCRNHVSWEIPIEDSPQVFTVHYTFESPPCGNSNQGDTLTLHVLGEASASPLALDTDWGGGATMTLCTRELGLDDACGIGDSLGVPARDP